MYKFEEILLGNKSELLKQASIPASQPKLLPPRSTTGTISGAGNATGTNPSMQPNKLGSGGNPLFGKSEAQRRVEQYTGTGTEYGPVARFSPFFRGPHYIGNDLTYFTRRGMPMTQTQFNTYAAVFGGDPREMNPSDAIDSAFNYANRHDVDYMGFNTGQQLNLAMGENRGQHARKTWTNNFNNGDEQVRRGMLISGFRPQGYDSEDYAGWQADMRANYGQQPQWNATDYLANSSVGGVLGQDIRQRNQGIQGWNNWNANADNIMYQQAQQREQQRQWQAQRDLQDAQKAIDKYDVGGNMKGKMTPQDWVAMNPLQRGEYINNYNRDQYKQRSEEILNNADVQAAERQRFADNMNRVHGKAWDARGFTQEQRDAFIDKEFQHSLDKRKQVVGPKMTEGVTQTAQAAPVQPVAPQKIEQDITPEENTTADVDIESKPGGSYILPAAPKSFEGVPIFDGGFYPQEEEEESIAQMPKKDGIEVKASANIMSILFPQRARDIVKEYF